MFYKSFRYFFILLYYFLVTLIGQTSRDAVVQIDTPYDGEVISDNYSCDNVEYCGGIGSNWDASDLWPIIHNLVCE